MGVQVGWVLRGARPMQPFEGSRPEGGDYAYSIGVGVVPLDQFLRRFQLHLLPKASCASATSVSCPTANVLLFCPFACNYSVVAPPQTNPDSCLVHPAAPLWFCPQYDSTQTMIAGIVLFQQISERRT